MGHQSVLQPETIFYHVDYRFHQRRTSVRHPFHGEGKYLDGIILLYSNAQDSIIDYLYEKINHIENPGLLATKIIVPHFMIERQSCAAPGD